MAETPGTDFDIVVLGGGSGGYAAALRAAQAGQTVALIEADKLGGTCLHYGCVPTKALLHAAEVADNARDGSRFGVQSTFNGIDMAGVNKYKDGVVAGLYKGLQGLIKSRKITVIEGYGRLVAENAIEVDGQRYTGKHIILATGSYSRSLPGLAIEGRVMSSEHALVMEHVPSSAIILGGGVIGSEFASVWKSFGSDVTIIEALPNLVPNEDVVISKSLERAFRRRGIKFNLGDRFSGVTQDDQGVHVTLESGKTFDAEILLVAIGRGPRTADIGFEEHGVKLDRGFVLTDERLHTGVGNIWAVGDIVPGLQLAHRGFAQGIYVAEQILGLNPAPIVESGIPRVTYSDPEIASVGLNESTAIEEYGAENVESIEYNLAGNGKSKILDTQGFIKLVRKKDGPVLGIHMIGARVGELIGESQLIVNWDAYPEDVASLIHAHPTQNEALGEAFLALAGKPLHAHN